MQESHTSDFENVKATIAAAGLKATQQRIVIYDALLKTEIHPTAEQIYDQVKLGNPSLSLGTIYKALDNFVHAGLACKVFNDEGYMRYDAKLDFHNHIYCSNTKEIIDYQDPELDKLIREFFSKKKITNLKINQIRLQINGEKENPNKEILIK